MRFSKNITSTNSEANHIMNSESGIFSREALLFVKRCGIVLTVALIGRLYELYHHLNHMLIFGVSLLFFFIVS
jgi:hypothetical protein